MLFSLIYFYDYLFIFPYDDDIFFSWIINAFELWCNLFPCSTVDQFSGESSPVILPLDDEQVSVIDTSMKFVAY